MQRITSSGHVTHLAASGDGRLVAYTTSDDKGQSISLAQTATNSSVTVVPAAAKPYFVGLAFTADSNYLLTTSYDSSVIGVMHRMALFGGAPTKLVEDIDTTANASPDGTSIVFTRDVLERGESRVLVAKSDGTNERIVATFPLPHRAVSPVWSPDGKRIAVAHGISLYTIDPVKATKSSVATNNWRGSIRDLSWSNNDTLLVSGADDHTSGHYQLFNIALNDGTVRNVTNDSDDYVEPRLAGSSIAAIQTKRQATLWSTDAHSTPLDLTRGLASSDGLGGATWTPDRHIVYTSSAAGPVDLWIANEDGSSPRQLTHDDALESDPAVTADGASIVYLTRSRTQSALWRINVDGSQAHQLATSPAIFAFAMTPDSKRAVYASCDDKSGCALMNVALNGGAPSLIARTGNFLNYVRITPDGAHVIFAALIDRTVKIQSVPIAGGTPALLYNERATNPMLSPDGKQIACMRDLGEMGADLAVFDIAGGGAPKVEKLGGWLYRWLPDGSIVYVKSAGKAENLFTFKDGQSKPITQFNDGTIVNLNVSPTGQILFTHVVETRDVVLLTQ